MSENIELQRLLGELSAQLKGLISDTSEIRKEIASINNRERSNQIELLELKQNLIKISQLEANLAKLGSDFYRYTYRVKALESWQQEEQEGKTSFREKWTGVAWQVIAAGAVAASIFVATAFGDGLRIRVREVSAPSTEDRNLLEDLNLIP